MAPYSFPVVTGLTAAALGILNIILVVYVGTARAKYKVHLGDGGHEALNRRVRMHGNLAENAPIFLILLGLVELTGRYHMTVAIIAPLFVLFRIIHPIGLSAYMSKRPNPFRGIGALGTVICQGVLAVELAIACLPHIAQW